MLEPLDRCRRDSTLFQFTTKRLRDFIDPDHLLVQIDERLDFAKLVAPLEERYCPDFGRPAIHPEVMVRALLICSLYNIASFRRLCSAISENIAYRWFCFLTIDDPVFDHSTITYFINRIGREGFSEVFHGLNRELLRMGLLAPELYVDSSLVKANVSSYGLTPSGMTVEEFRQQAIEENGLFTLTGTTVDGDGVEHEEVRYFQSPEGRLPLNPVDTGARWRTSRPGKPSGLHYQENVIVDLGGFIVARGVTHASQEDGKPSPACLSNSPWSRSHWLEILATTWGNSENSWRNGTSRPIYRSTPSRKATWSPREVSLFMATTWCVPKARHCAAPTFTERIWPTNMWLSRRIAKPAQ